MIHVLYTNVDQTLPNKLHGAAHCKIGLQWTRVLYTVVITWQSYPPISQFNSPCNVSGQCSSCAEEQNS